MSIFAALRKLFGRRQALPPLEFEDDLPEDAAAVFPDSTLAATDFVVAQTGEPMPDQPMPVVSRYRTGQTVTIPLAPWDVEELDRLVSDILIGGWAVLGLSSPFKHRGGVPTAENIAAALLDDALFRLIDKRRMAAFAAAEAGATGNVKRYLGLLMERDAALASGQAHEDDLDRRIEALWLTMDATERAAADVETAKAS